MTEVSKVTEDERKEVGITKITLIFAILIIKLAIASVGLYTRTVSLQNQIDS